MVDLLARMGTKLGIVAFWPFDGAGSITVIDGTEEFSTSPAESLNRIILIAVGIAVAVGIILVAAAGYRMMSSGGDAAKLKDARDQLQNAILGLILVLAAVTIMGIIFNIIGIEGIL